MQEEETTKKPGSGNGHSDGHPNSSGSMSTSAISADSSTRNYVDGCSSDDEEILMDEDYSDDEELPPHLRHKS